MIWKFLLLAFILIFVVVTVLNVRKTYVFFVNTFTADDECIKQEFRGLLSRKDLYVMSLGNLLNQIIIALRNKRLVSVHGTSLLLFLNLLIREIIIAVLLLDEEGGETEHVGIEPVVAPPVLSERRLVIVPELDDQIPVDEREHHD